MFNVVSRTASLVQDGESHEKPNAGRELPESPAVRNSSRYDDKLPEREKTREKTVGL